MRHVFARIRTALGGRPTLPAPRWRADVRALGTHRGSLGENPRWRQGDDWLHWLDVHAGTVRGTRLIDGAERSWTVGAEAGAMAVETGGALIVAVDDRLLRLHPTTGTVEFWTTIEALDVARCRANDMAWAPSGELLIATMDRRGRDPLGKLIGVDLEGRQRTIVDGLQIGNGPAVDSRRAIAYLADSPRGTIQRVPLTGTRSGAPARAEPFVTIAGEVGAPDGMAVTSAGALWVAHYDGGCLSCWAGSGALLGWIAMPVKRPTAIAVLQESPSLRLAVTSARADGDDGGGGLWIVEVAR